MTVLPGLTTTRSDRIPGFIEDLRESSVRTIALFPTALLPPERHDLYRELAAIPDLRIPHVHLRSDFDEAEIALLVERFNAHLFNIHPAASQHSFGPVPGHLAGRIYVENVDVAAQDEELESLAGVCPDYSHLENARLQGRTDYVERTESQMRRFRVGCCHVSAIRPDEPNPWSGGADHHSFTGLSDFDYMERYAQTLPFRWVSLELENSLSDQLRAAEHVTSIVSGVTDLR